MKHLLLKGLLTFAFALMTVVLFSQTLSSDNGTTYLYESIMSEYELPNDGSIGMTEFRSLVVQHCIANNYPVEYYSYSDNGFNNQQIVNYCYYDCHQSDVFITRSFPDGLKEAILGNFAPESVGSDESIDLCPCDMVNGTGTFSNTYDDMITRNDCITVVDTVVISTVDTVYINVVVKDTVTQVETIVLTKLIGQCDCSSLTTYDEVIEFAEVQKELMLKHKRTDHDLFEVHKNCYRSSLNYARHHRKDINGDGKYGFGKETVAKKKKANKIKRKAVYLPKTRGKGNGFFSKLFPYMNCGIDNSTNSINNRCYECELDPECAYYYYWIIFNPADCENCYPDYIPTAIA